MSAAKKKTAAKKAPAKKKAVTVLDVAKNLDKVVANTDSAMKDLRADMETNQNSIMEAINAIASGGKSTRAMDNPTHFNVDRIEAAEENLGQAVSLTDEDNTFIAGTKYDDVESPSFQNKMALEAFMNESVCVHIQEAMTDENVAMFDVGVNGKTVIFRYGETKIVPRYIVEGLARARPVHYGNERYRKSDGSDGVKNPASRGLRYPFTVEQDLNPRGGQWLREILSQQ